MAERNTLARPYAEAAFAYAREAKALDRWSGRLKRAALVAADPEVAGLAQSPSADPERFRLMFLDLCAAKEDIEFGHFIRLLLENRRLALLPEIAALYEQRRITHESAIDAEVVSALPLDGAQEKQIIEALTKSYGRAVRLTSRVDAALLGGVVIRVGDQVIDASARGRLAQLQAHLNRI